MRRKINGNELTGGARGGRPRLENAYRRDRRIGVPVNEEEDEAIGGKAELSHMKKGTFLRHLGLGRQIRRPVSAINYRSYRQLGRLAADFGYALALIEAGKNIGIDRQLAERILDEIRHIENLLVMSK
jgi:hypothetical protein